MSSKLLATAQIEAAFLIMHIKANVPLVRVGGILSSFDQSVREDFTEASLESARRARILPTVELALMGGEPYERWV